MRDDKTVVHSGHRTAARRSNLRDLQLIPTELKI